MIEYLGGNQTSQLSLNKVFSLRQLLSGGRSIKSCLYEYDAYTIKQNTGTYIPLMDSAISAQKTSTSWSSLFSAKALISSSDSLSKDKIPAVRENRWYRYHSHGTDK